MPPPSPRQDRSELQRHRTFPFWKVLAFYGILALAVIGLVAVFPGVERPAAADGAVAPAAESSVQQTGSGLELGKLGTRGLAVDVSLLGPRGLVIYTLISVIAAALLMIPVTWVYTVTRGKKGWSQSTVQTLIILPIAVSGMIIVVQDSIALAFSLTGIVAAVRFRTTLHDTKDAVFVFVALAVGLAAGVQALIVAAIVSIGFNVAVLVLWAADIGRVPPDIAEGVRRRRRARRLAAATAGGLTDADPELLAAMTPEQLRTVGERARRISDTVGELTTIEDLEDRMDDCLFIHASNPEMAQEVAEELFQNLAKSWILDGIKAVSTDETRLEYRIRLKKRTKPTELVSRLVEHGKGSIRSVEFK